VIASIVIIGVSTVLFLYWFRYTCELILSARTVTNFAPGVSAANGLNLTAVSAELEVAPAGMLGHLVSGLNSDYKKLDSVLNRSAAMDADQIAFERAMLRGYFCFTSAMFSVVKHCSDGTARKVLATMARVVEYQANLIAEQARPAEISLS
jgi:hypothetical protein